MSLQRKKKKLATRKNIEIDNDILEFLSEEYPNDLWYLTNKLFRNFMDLHRDNAKGLKGKMAKVAARNTLREINQ